MKYNIKFIPGISMRTANELNNGELYRGQWAKEFDREWLGLIDESTGQCVEISSRLITHKVYGKIEHASIQLFDKYTTGKEHRVDVTRNLIQYVKDTVFGDNRFAIQVYPKEDNLVDVSNVYHIWIFDKYIKDPFLIKNLKPELDATNSLNEFDSPISIYNTEVVINNKKYPVKMVSYISENSSSHFWNDKYEMIQGLFGNDVFAIEDFPFNKDSKSYKENEERIFVFDKSVDMPFGIHPFEYPLTKYVNRGAYTPNKSGLMELDKILKIIHG